MPSFTIQYRDANGDGPVVSIVAPTKREACLEVVDMFTYMANFDLANMNRRRWWHLLMWWL